jgi:hypothetical protein
MAMVAFDDLTQQRIVASQRNLHRRALGLPEFAAALDPSNGCRRRRMAQGPTVEKFYTCPAADARNVLVRTKFISQFNMM